MLCRKQCFEVLKVVEFTFKRIQAMLSQSMPMMLRHMANELLAVFRPVRAKLSTTARLDDAKREILAAVRSSSTVGCVCVCLLVTR